MHLSDEESKLYTLIWERFIASQMPDAEYLSTSAKVFVEENVFIARGREVFLMDSQKFLRVHQRKRIFFQIFKRAILSKEKLLISNKNLLSLPQDFLKQPLLES